MKIPEYWQEAIEYLSVRDKIIKRLILCYPKEILRSQNNPFYTLTRAIVGQQVSVKSANSIWQKLESQLDDFSPECYLSLKVEDLRNCGLSRQKINYIKNISTAFLENKLTPGAWHQMTDTEVIDQLISLKGIGTWTAQMFLIFYLQRPDILPLADIGLINAIQKYYGEKQKLSQPEIINIAQKWQPYRTVATWYLWRSLDPLPVEY